MPEIQFFVRYLRDIREGKLHLSKALGPFETADQAKQVAFGLLQQMVSFWAMVCEKPGAREEAALWTASLRFDVSPGSWGAPDDSGQQEKGADSHNSDKLGHPTVHGDTVDEETAEKCSRLADSIFHHQYAFEFPEIILDSISKIPAGEEPLRAFLNTAEARGELELLYRVVRVLGLNE